jgi:hypothetical protein
VFDRLTDLKFTEFSQDVAQLLAGIATVGEDVSLIELEPANEQPVKSTVQRYYLSRPIYLLVAGAARSECRSSSFRAR